MNKFRITTAALIIAASASAASAQDYSMEEMDAGFTMLETSVANAFRQYRIDVDPRSLSLGQLSVIKTILHGSEGEGEKRQRITAIANR